MFKNHFSFSYYKKYLIWKNLSLQAQDVDLGSGTKGPMSLGPFLFIISGEGREGLTVLHPGV